MSSPSSFYISDNASDSGQLVGALHAYRFPAPSTALTVPDSTAYANENNEGERCDPLQLRSTAVHPPLADGQLHRVDSPANNNAAPPAVTNAGGGAHPIQLQECDQTVHSTSEAPQTRRRSSRPPLLDFGGGGGPPAPVTPNVLHMRTVGGSRDDRGAGIVAGGAEVATSPSGAVAASGDASPASGSATRGGPRPTSAHRRAVSFNIPTALVPPQPTHILQAQQQQQHPLAAENDAEAPLPRADAAAAKKAVPAPTADNACSLTPLPTGDDIIDPAGSDSFLRVVAHNNANASPQWGHSPTTTSSSSTTDSHARSYSPAMPTVTATAEESGPLPYEEVSKVGDGVVHIGTQVVALLERTCQQHWHGKLALLAEIVVPLIFVVLLIILDVSFGKDRLYAINYLDGTDLEFQINVEDYTTYMCYGDPAAPINGLSPCATPIEEYATCDGDESAIPVSSLCFGKVFRSPQMVVVSYLEAMTGSLVALPSLDSIIVHQWMAKKAELATNARALSALAALSNAGLGQASSTRYDAITYSGKLFFAPAVNVPDALLNYFNTTSSLFRYTYGGTFATVEEAEQAMRHGEPQQSIDSIWGLIIVNDIVDHFDVKVQLHNKAMPSLQSIVDVKYAGGYAYDGADMYVASGFLSLQKMLYDYFIESKAAAGDIATMYRSAAIYPLIAGFPTVQGTRKYLVDFAGPLMAFVMVLAFLYPFSQMTKRLVLEKELRIREAMLIMGLQKSSLWISFFLMGILENVLISLLVTVLLCATVATRSTPFDVFLMILVYSLTTVPLAGLTSTFFSKARLAALLSPLLYFVLSMPVFAMNQAKDSVVLGLSVFSPTAFAQLMSQCFLGEGGSGFSSRDYRSNPYLTPQPYTLFLMLMGDALFYFLLMLYLDAVLPQEWGSTKHPLFFITEPFAALRRCCCAGSSQDPEEDPVEVADSETGNVLHGGTLNGAKAQWGSPNRDPTIGVDAHGKPKEVSIRVKGLYKHFNRSGKRFVAVEHLSWEMYKGEISVLLGPNGAGKSTTINMMTGMLTPDAGDCVMAGHSIRHHLDAARHQIGFCPQHNILWPNLTVRQHLEFFAKIKGLRGAVLEDAVVDILRAVDLLDKVDDAAQDLSGGQKRKLSVAVAFVGRSSIVLLDEPTSGMDAAARRHTWSLLRAMSENRTILLTTHFMDEADLLGDHIAIVNRGALQCAGSNLFLRGCAGAGYSVRFDLLPITATTALRSGSITAISQANRDVVLVEVWDGLRRLVLSHFPNATLHLQTDCELEYGIPPNAEHTTLPAFLRDVEGRGNRSLGIRGYALCAPTLEDVFMRIVERANQQGDATTSSSIGEAHSTDAVFDAVVVGPSPGTVAAGNSTAGVAAERPNSRGGRGASMLHRRMSRASMRFLNGEAPDLTQDEVLHTIDAGIEALPPDEDPTEDIGNPYRGNPTDFFWSVVPPDGEVSDAQRKKDGEGECQGAAGDPQGVPAVARQPSLPLGGSEDPSLSELLKPVEKAVKESRTEAREADMHLDQVWSIRPVTSTRQLWGLQLKAMLYKRFFYSLRDRRMQFFQIICPVLCIFIAMLLQLVNSTYKGTLVYGPTMFKEATEVELSQCSRFLGDLSVIPTMGNGLDHVTWNDGNFINTLDMNNYLQDTWYNHRSGARYAAVQCADLFIQKELQAIYPTVIGNRLPMVMQFNTSSKHSLPFVLQTVFELIYLDGLLNVNGRNSTLVASLSSWRFTTAAQALPMDRSAKKSSNAITSILIGIIVLIPFTFLPANPVAWVVKERETRARHLQRLSGLRYLLYWVGNFIFDFLAYLVTLALVLAIFAIFSRWEYVGSDAIGASLVAFVLYGLCCCCGSYAMSFFFKEHTTAQMVVLGVSFLTGFICVLLVFILGLLEWTLEAANVLRWVFRVLPTYAVGEVILNLALLEQKQLTDPSLTVWSYEMTVWACIYMAVEIPLFAAFTLFWDHPSRPSIVERFLACWRGAFLCGSGGSRSDDLQRRPRRRRWYGRRHHKGQARDRHASGDENPAPVITTVEDERVDGAERGSRQQHDDAVSGLPNVIPISPAAGQRGGRPPLAPAAPGPSPRAADLSGGRLEHRHVVAVQIAGNPGMLSLLTPNSGEATMTAMGAGAGGSGCPPPRPMVPTEGGSAEAPSAGLRQRRGSVSNSQSVSMQQHQPQTQAEARTQRLRAESAFDSYQAALREPDAPKGENRWAYKYPPPHSAPGDKEAREEEDSDVEEERLAVYRDEDGQSRLGVTRVVDLRKVYTRNHTVAVRSLSFEVMPGEVFAFLGTNGAGKTTALSILTQEQLPTSGRAYVSGHDVVRDSTAAMQHIGYCPQFDACFDLLTVHEHLNLYACIRGVPSNRRGELIDCLLHLCDLVSYANVLSRQLSGGNRRKLSVAIALLGTPKVVCLDEPSSGMDPLARRALWRALDRVSKKCSIILTTHHLEEVEALADCVAIMVAGSLRCIGDLPHLKNKYARNAYELTIRVAAVAAAEATASPNARPRARSRSITYDGVDMVNDEDRIVRFMAEHFPSAQLVENFNDERYVYSIPTTRDVARAMSLRQHQVSAAAGRRTSQSGSAAAPNSVIVCLSDIFETLQEHRQALGITEYSVSQVSLEQVFLRVCTEDDVADASMVKDPLTAPHAPTATAPSVFDKGIGRRRPSMSALAQSASEKRRQQRRRASAQSRKSIAISRYQSFCASRRSVGGVCYAEYRRRRARRLLALASHEDERQRLSEPDHEDSHGPAACGGEASVRIRH